MLPTRRDLRFKLTPESVRNWHAQGPQVAHFFNALSIFFPTGERFFINSVRQYRERVTDPELQKAITAFIGQEAMHGREHEEYNDLLAQAGFPIHRMEGRVNALLEWGKKKLPAISQLSATIALEHFTAIMADRLLRKPDMIASADPRMVALWRWHALEETEHKAVAFDVYRAVRKPSLKNYITRSSGLLIATVIFLGFAHAYQRELVNADKTIGKWDGMGNYLRFMFAKGGFVRDMAGPWFDYLKPGFHPWDHDNRHFLAEIDTLIAEAKRFDMQEAA
ncbi:metal-dependent hydrolase [Stenotrophobium rhamnosiphilum]|uniref:Metal-dependent hydrolase n=1 Tax=Stenotrophobium rhamnosiphilum TaxID=2029166 RepID=A0A2T5ML26_9GAMM|nr:metal-dependent hydrolase [Stenotrophobium rhamnosiphilum]PTU33258.1 metal-dependent hydrolase [Stenotrophobium rhamnosiphilum]